RADAPRCASREVNTTWTPCATSATAVSNPMPELPPVINAVRSVSCDTARSVTVRRARPCRRSAGGGTVRGTSSGGLGRDRPRNRAGADEFQAYTVSPLAPWHRRHRDRRCVRTRDERVLTLELGCGRLRTVGERPRRRAYDSGTRLRRVRLGAGRRRRLP